jgi:leucyl/phenylalanyl-tRNA--protein transferase
LTIYRLNDDLVFPSPSEAEPTGLLAVGGDLSAERLLLAYRYGIFPWYDEPPILWFSPDPRMTIRPRSLHVPRRLARTLRQGRFTLTLDQAFPAVIRACADTDRGDGLGTWISEEMIDAYCRLHELGFAHSCEAWQEGELVGGIYGVSLGAGFFGESMFHQRRDASKVALVALLRQLAHWGFELFDCQLHTDHLARFGAEEIPRARFLQELELACRMPTRRGIWTFDAPAADQET